MQRKMTSERLQLLQLMKPSLHLLGVLPVGNIALQQCSVVSCALMSSFVFKEFSCELFDIHLLTTTTKSCQNKPVHEETCIVSRSRVTS